MAHQHSQVAAVSTIPDARISVRASGTRAVWTIAGLGVGATSAIWAAAIVGVSLAVVVNRDTLNHDGLTYISLARHYLQGRWDLAIVGTWSPLFVWLLAALDFLVGDSVLAARLAMGVSAIVFIAGGIAVAGLVTTRLARIATAASIVGVAVASAGAQITPDLLSAGFYAFGCVILLQAEKKSIALVAGGIFGLGYLTKAIVLPAAFAVSILFGAALTLAGRQRSRQAALNVVACIVGLMVVALPWIGILSAKYGQLTLTTAQRGQYAALGPPAVRQAQPTNRMFVVPEAGRHTQFEDESVLPVTSWSPFENVGHALYLIRRAVGNVPVVLRSINQFDLLGIGLLAAIVLFAQLLLSLRSDASSFSPAGLFLLPIAIPTLGYLPGYADQWRYYLLGAPFLYACGVDGARRVGPFLHRQWGTTLCVLFAAAAFLASSALLLPTMAFRANETAQFRLTREIARSLERAALIGPVVSAAPLDMKHYAIYLSFNLGTTHHGTNPTAITAEDIDRSCARLIFAAVDSPQAAAMEAEPDRFRDLARTLPDVASALGHTDMKLFWVADDRSVRDLRCASPKVYWHSRVF